MQMNRLFKIVYYLLERGKSTAPELADKFEVSIRTIYRIWTLLVLLVFLFMPQKEKVAVYLSCRTLC